MKKIETRKMMKEVLNRSRKKAKKVSRSSDQILPGQQGGYTKYGNNRRNFVDDLARQAELEEAADKGFVKELYSNELQYFVKRFLKTVSVSNEELLARAIKKESISIRRRKWGWIGHTHRQPTSNANRESTGEEESRPPQGQLEKNRGRRGGQGRINLEADRDVSSKQIEMAVAFLRSMLHEEWKGIGQVRLTLVIF